MTRILCYAPDLMDQSRVRRMDGEIEFVTRASDLLGQSADLIVIDLDRPDSSSVLDRLSTKTIGFAAHVDAERLHDAKAAGIDEALPRSVFFKRYCRE